MNFVGESVGVVTQRVLNLAEYLFGWRVGESLGHLAYPLFQEWLETFHQLPDAGLAVVCRRGNWVVGVCHDVLAGGDFASPTSVWPTPPRFAPTFSGRTRFWSGQEAVALWASRSADFD